MAKTNVSARVDAETEQALTAEAEREGIDSLADYLRHLFDHRDAILEDESISFGSHPRL